VVLGTKNEALGEGKKTKFVVIFPHSHFPCKGALVSSEDILNDELI
jgi:hypothetical protein